MSSISFPGSLYRWLASLWRSASLPLASPRNEIPNDFGDALHYRICIIVDMNKSVILFFAIIFEIAGSFFPMLFGNNDIFSGWGILGGLVGGLFGVWVGVIVSKRFF